ncbi:hypothetical protein HY624_00435 [Candidatus Uhrbacteria bacterium]|nr:hypothetical protein [Candidatus Uhrbacteria bacterium]
MQKITLLTLIIFLMMPVFVFAHAEDGDGTAASPTPVLQGTPGTNGQPQNMMAWTNSGYGWGWMYPLVGGFGWFAILMFTVMGLFWALVLALLIGLVRWVWKKGS